ncbi:DUF2474 family protein [Sphingomonas gei]|uniref:DUF2474 family protein n=1 Tax=Sphingomonas gei TaxID=1395960 RepID=A0A4S1XIZ5_9SPHN|nr:DUF2474 family protein [Sphingomonas gei]TGX55730.1 DUF2474 family protein [Sphingomonas gei]
MRRSVARLGARLGWFVGIWLASVLALAAVGGIIRAILAP